MDKVLTKPYLDIRYEKQDADTYPIRLRVTYKRKQYYYPTGKSLSIPDWCRMYGIPDKEGKKHGKTTEKLKGNLLELGELELKARRIIEKMTGFDFKSFRAKMDDQEATDTISSHFNRYINSLGEHSHIKTARNYESALASLEKFRPGSLLNQITTDFLKDYKDWMLGEKKSVTTLSMYARCIRTIINKAISDKEFPRDD
ncbi:MAG: phage integrase SAM-like domain-containing protein, partial [Ferruginibacter sp.]